MAQSSNYKQYTRATRVLTEESGFAGGMLWTGNNIDETHVKALVNLDYDDTTGYLKTRDPFVATTDVDLTEVLKDTDINLMNYSLLGTYSLGATNTTDDTVTDAGQLYIFANPTSYNNVWETAFGPDDFVCLFKDSVDDWHVCANAVNEGTVLRNITVKNTLSLYDNHLYSVGRCSAEGLWLFVYQLRVDITDAERTVYTLTQLEQEVIQEKIDSVTLLEACETGFNAARGNRIFTYNSVKVEHSPYILGHYFKDESDNVIISPRIGQDVTIHIQTAYKEGTNRIALFELNESGTATKDIENLWSYIPNSLLASEDGSFVFPHKFSKRETTLAIAFYGTNEVSDTPKLYSEVAVDHQAPWVVTANNNIDNLKLKSYDLTSVDGSCIWNNRMCLWGTDNNNNCLFMSEVDNFYYYPVPHSVAVFDTNIISCIPYKNTLLVFTADKIYRLSVNNDGSIIQDVVQNDMPLSKTDSTHLTAIKNMVLFKSGNYFYMVVPKSQSLTDELSIAPIYKNIAGFLNTLDNSVLEVLQLLYPEYLIKRCEKISSNPAYVYSEQDTVHIVYNVTAYSQTLQTSSYYFKLFLNYNTNLRAWTLYVENTTTATLDVAALTAARTMSFVRVTAPYKFSVVTQQHVFGTQQTFRALLDTGYRTLSSSTQKRFREIQLKLYSESENITSFGTAFLVDGVFRRSYTKLQEFVSEGVVNLMPELDLNTFVTELSMPVNEDGTVSEAPGSDAIELSDWRLDFSHFKRGAPITIRIPVSGKGFNPRFILMMPDANNVHINDVNWVYRLMYGR